MNYSDLDMKKNDLIESAITIICPSPKGLEIALLLQNALKANIYIKDKKEGYRLEIYSSNENESSVISKSYESSLGEKLSLNNIARKVMANSRGIIFISSTGIAVRVIAPFIIKKDKDPGVVVVDLSKKYAISLLSGHLGGGNNLAIKVSNVLGCEHVITTATDNLGIIAPDIIAKENSLIIDDLKKAKYIASLLVDEKIVGIKDEYDLIKITKGYEKVHELKENCIWITHCLKDNKINGKEINYSKILKLVMKDLVLGIGCRRNTSYEKLKQFVEEILKNYNFDVRAINKIVSIDVKKDEEGLIKLAQHFKCSFKTFESDKIKTVQDKYEKSEFVLKTLGVTGVCEPCVELAGGTLIINKIKHDGMTLSIGILDNMKENNKSIFHHGSSTICNNKPL